MQRTDLDTAFAPAERASAETVNRQHELLEAQTLAKHVVDGLPHSVMVLNKYRQIVMVNAALLSLLQKPLVQIMGKRPGEALGCIHSAKTPGGCGTTESCRDCGAVLAILAAQEGQVGKGECCVRLHGSGHGADLELAVQTAPLEVEGEVFTLVCVSDISGVKRRRSLERIFFHDVLNTVGNLSGFAHLISDPANTEKQRHAKIIEDAAIKLIEEIVAQKDLLAAENGELRVQPAICGSLSALEQAAKSFEQHPLTRDRRLLVDNASCTVSLVTDVVLLRRVLINLIKNALEACPAGDAVTMGCQSDEKRVRFWVRNPGQLSPSVRELIFHKSFSTKGIDRGLGTYSIHLLTTRYLQGRVGFESSAEAGTVFHVDLPTMLQ